MGQSGLLKSNLRAQKLIVTGRFIGTADCEQIELISGGEAEGKLISAGLVIDASSSFQGESIRRKEGETPKVLDFSADAPPRDAASVNRDTAVVNKDAKKAP